jgi:hypothetical protein
MKLGNAVQSVKNYPLFSHKKRKVHGVRIRGPTSSVKIGGVRLFIIEAFVLVATAFLSF